jgi:hypothetical protein
MPNIQDQFGQIDIYLFDQRLRGRIAPGMRIFDAACGFGRNLCGRMPVETQRNEAATKSISREWSRINANGNWVAVCPGIVAGRDDSWGTTPNRHSSHSR